MEIRFTRQSSVTSFISRVLHESLQSITFEKIFSRELWRKAVLIGWTDIVDQPYNQLALKMDLSYGEALNAILARRKSKNDGHSLNQALTSFGLFVLINQFGHRFVREKFETLWSNKSCGTRLNKKIAQSAVALSEIPVIPIISLIGSMIKEFERFDVPFRPIH